MKKTYMMPTLTVVNVKIDSLLGDASLPQTNSTDASVEGTEYKNALSRENHSIWDDEE